MNSNKYFILIKNTLIFGFGLLGTKFVQFILLPYFTNVLTPAEYGVIDLIITFASLMVPIVTANLADAVLRFGLSVAIEKDELLQNMLIVLACSIGITILMSPFLMLYHTISVWKNYVVIIIILQSIRTNFSLYIKANDRLVVYSLDSILMALIIAVSDIILISYHHLGIKGYLLSEIIGTGFSIFFLLTKGNVFRGVYIYKKINILLLKDMLRYSFPLMFNAISWWITNFSDRMVLDYFFSETEVGIYSVAAKMPAIVTTVLSVFTQAWIMSAVKEYETSKDKRFFQRVYTYYCAALFSGVAVVILVVKAFMKIYVGEKFFEAWRYVPFLLLGVVFLGISNYYGAIYAAAKENIREVRSTVICAVTNIFLNFCLIPFWGTMGAVFATMLSYVVIVVVRMFDTKKIFEIDTKPVLLVANGICVVLEVLFIVIYDNIIWAGGSVALMLMINIRYVFINRRCQE